MVLHWRDFDMTMTYMFPQTVMSFVSQFSTDREIYAIEKITFEYPWKMKSSLSCKPFDLLWRDFAMTMIYTLPQIDMSCVSQIPTDREIYAFEKFNFE
jgi:hypothetical protein